MLPYWESRIVPELRAGKNVLIVAHGNSLRALVKMLDMMSESDIVEFNIPTGIPILYELDEQLQPLGRRFLGDPQPSPRRKRPCAGKPRRSDARSRAYERAARRPQESGAMATLMPDSASVKSTWQDRREVASRKSGNSFSSSSSSLCGFGKRAGPALIDIHVAGGAGTQAAAYRGDAVIELAQDLHDLQTGLRLDLMLFAVPVHYDHPRH